MAKKISSVVGIDIGSKKIKLAELKGQGKEPLVTALGMVDTPEGAVDQTGVYDSEAVGAAIKQLFAESGASVSQVVCSIAGQQSVLVRTIEVPRMTPPELKEHMQWEVTRNVPFAEPDIVSDFRALEDSDPTSQNMEVVMAISPQSAVDTLVACVKKASKTMFAIDVEPLGISRALRHQNGAAPTEVVCVVDIGHKTTSINMYRHGNLLMPRQVPIGGEMFTRAIADSLNVSMEEAEALKQEKAEVPASAAAGSLGGGATAAFVPYNPFSEDPINLNPALAPAGSAAEPEGAESAAEAPATADDTVSPEATRLFNAMAPILEEFVAEIRRSIDYFRSKGGDVHRIEITGGGARLRGLQQFLEASLGLPTEVFDPLRGLTVSTKTPVPDSPEERTAYTVAIGNGLHIFFE